MALPFAARVTLQWGRHKGVMSAGFSFSWGLRVNIHSNWEQA